MPRTAERFKTCNSYEELTISVKTDYGFDNFVYDILNLQNPTLEQKKSLFNQLKSYETDYLHNSIVSKKKLKDILSEEFNWVRTIYDLN